FLTKAFASKSQPEPSFGNTTSIGSPLDNCCVALYPSVIPIGYSPEPANFAGFEPECVYVAIFYVIYPCNCKHSFSPIIE
ncbi:hypothetical protein BM530_22755, partial [Clostridioides difficile]